MSYEEDYRKPYRAKCACGKGFLRYYEISLSNDWGQIRESSTPIEWFCDECKKKYYYKSIRGNDYLVPNELSVPEEVGWLDAKYRYNEKENLIQKYSKNDIEDIIADMTAPKHRYIKNLENKLAIEFANNWVRRYGKKSLKPMVSYLRNILSEYDSLKASYEQKKPFVDQHLRKEEEYVNAFMKFEEESIQISFEYDYEQDQRDQEKAQLEQKKYEEEHRYDDFMAQVRYDSSYKRDFTGQYWDSYLIKECIDPQYLILDKPKYGTPNIVIAKKYLCICQICGKEKEILSSDMKIDYDEYEGYYLKCCCDCHKVSSFEAKTMEILNQLGIKYIREKSFEKLVGDSSSPLRFDFALFKESDNAGNPIIDLVIELQGPHHYQQGYYDEFGDYITDNIDKDLSGRVQENFTRQLRYDEKKEEYCKQRGINLETIKYTTNSYEALEKKIIKILKKYGYRYYVEEQ